MGGHTHMNLHHFLDEHLIQLGIVCTAIAGLVSAIVGWFVSHWKTEIEERKTRLDERTQNGKTRLNERKADIEEYAMVLESYKSLLADLRQELELTKGRIEQLATELHEAHTGNEQTWQRLGELQTQVDELRTAYEGEHRERIALGFELDKVRAENVRLKAEVDDLRKRSQGA